MNHLLNNLIRNSCYVSSCKCTVCYMYRISYTCTYNLCLDIIIRKYTNNIFNKLDTRL